MQWVYISDALSKQLWPQINELRFTVVQENVYADMGTFENSCGFSKQKLPTVQMSN